MWWATVTVLLVYLWIDAMVHLYLLVASSLLESFSANLCHFLHASRHKCYGHEVLQPPMHYTECLSCSCFFIYVWFCKSLPAVLPPSLRAWRFVESIEERRTDWRESWGGKVAKIRRGRVTGARCSTISLHKMSQNASTWLWVLQLGFEVVPNGNGDWAHWKAYPLLLD